MEVRGVIRNVQKPVRFCVCVLLLTVFFNAGLLAQPAPKKYSIKNGRMIITLGKNITEASLDSFIAQYELYDLGLKQLLKDNSLDSLKKMGWKVEENDEAVCVISKLILSLDNINFNNPGDKIIMAEKPDFAELFPAVSSQVRYGYNRFRNKSPFFVQDSIVTFFLRGNTSAKRVILSGSFINWLPDALLMTLTDSGWIAKVKLGPGKYWYKFIVDGKWMVDRDNLLVENDGLGNDNSVFFKPNTVFRLGGFSNAKKVHLAGSFNNWNEKELLMTRKGSGWELPVYLADGTHTYRFVVDGEWMADPANPDRFQNEFKEYNSVIRIGKPYLFQLDGYADAKQVVLSGSFNGWRKDELYMQKNATGWELPYTLGPGNYEYQFIIDGKFNTDNRYFIIGPNYTFRLKGFGDAKAVFLAGDFNGWAPNTFAMKREGDEWVFAVHIDPGKHLYKFVVDGKWIIDPANKLWEQNESGTGNSVIWIEKKQQDIQ